MPIRNTNDGFDDYRRERRRQQVKLGPTGSTLGFENNALRELEAVEARESRDQQLTREVHDFFAAATRQAASIVERVAHEAQLQAGVRVEQEMESFLIDSLARMNTFVVAALHDRRNAQVAETQMEPTVANLVGPVLDEFRWEGTADMQDKHIGQDPFATSVEEVQRAFRAQVGDAVVEEAPESIEHHLVAEVQDDSPEPEAGESDRTEAQAEPEAANDVMVADAESPAPVAAPAADRAEPSAGNAGVAEELNRFKSALKALVRQSVMSRQEASAAWQTRLKSLGLSSR